MSFTILKKYKEVLVSYFVFIVFLNIFFFNQLYSEGHIEYGDMTVPENADNYLKFYYPIWNELGSGANFATMPRIPIFTPMIIFARLFMLDTSILYKFFILFPFLLCFTFVRLLFKSIIAKGEFYAFLAGIIFSLNPWTFGETVHFAMLWGFCLLPLNLYLLIKLLDKPSFLRIFLFSVSLIIIFITPHTMVHNMLGLSLFTLLYLFRNPSAFKKYFFKITLTLGLVLILSSFWLLPYIFSIKAGYQVGPSYIFTQDVLDMLSRNSDILKVLTLSSTWWPQTPFYLPNTYLIWFFSSLLITSFAILALIIGNGKKIYQVYFGFLITIGIFMALGSKGISQLYTLIAFNIPLSSLLGWMFRNPERWLPFIVFSYAMLVPMFISSISQKYVRRVIATLFVFCFLFFSFSTAYYYQKDILNPIKIPNEFKIINNWLKSDLNNFHVLWFPNYNGKKSEWSQNHMLGDFATLNSARPSFGDSAIFTRFYLNYVLNKDISINFEDNFYDVLNIKYLIIHDDVVGLENYSQKLIFNLNQSDGLNLAKKEGFIYVFENNKYSEYFESKNDCFIIEGGLDKFDSFNKLKNFKELKNCVIFLDQSFKESSIDSIFQDSTLVNIDRYFYPTKVSNIIISPFSILERHNPSLVWSKATTEDPLHGDWHPYLNKFGIENWDFDYGKGLVFTWAASALKKDVKPSQDDMVYDINFDNGENQFSYINSNYLNTSVDKKSIDRKTLKVEIAQGNNSNWMVVSSDYIDFKDNNYYAFGISLSAKDVNQVHAKITYYDEDDNAIKTDFIFGGSDGTFDFTKKENILLTPKETTKAKLQFWVRQNPNTTSYYWIDDVKIYDLQKYVEPVNLDMKFKINNTDNYDLYIRYMTNQKGGEIKLAINGLEISEIDTKDQLNKFVWKKVGTYNLTKDEYTLTLTNIEGFNAVNLFAVIPSEETKNYEKEVEDLVKDKKIIYIFEAESDMYYNNSNITYIWNTSNGQVLNMSNGSQAYQSFEVIKKGNYKFSIFSQGPFNLYLEDKIYFLNSTTNEIGPLTLDKGIHNFKIKPVLTNNKKYYLDVVWIYSVNDKKETLQNIFTENQTPATVNNFQKINPTLWKVKINATKPFMLSFAESYDPLWVAKIKQANGKWKEYQPVPLYSVINGFWINETGNLDITVEYKPQRWFYIGAAISLATLLSCISYLVYDRIRSKKGRIHELNRQIKEIDEEIDKLKKDIAKINDSEKLGPKAEAIIKKAFQDNLEKEEIIETLTDIGYEPKKAEYMVKELYLNKTLIKQNELKTKYKKAELDLRTELLIKNAVNDRMDKEDIVEMLIHIGYEEKTARCLVKEYYMTRDTSKQWLLK